MTTPDAHSVNLRLAAALRTMTQERDQWRREAMAARRRELHRLAARMFRDATTTRPTLPLTS
ncbi:MAG: hypothetical protein ACYC3L_01270 [Gemmatimonadaceae bacterium]